MQYDVIIVGAGPAGLACAIELKKNNNNLAVCVLEKGVDVGAHLISGAVFDPKYLYELIPDWEEKLNIELKTKVTKDKFYFLSAKKSFRLPVIKNLKNKNNFIISLSQLGKSLAEYAENLGVEIFSNFAAHDFIFDDNNQVIGVKIHDGEILAKNTIIAEGARGSLAKKIINHYRLDKKSQPQVYSLGIKELWKVDEKIAKKFKPGLVIHTVGWPLNSQDHQSYGGGFLYFLDNNLLSVGLISGLDYSNPTFDPFQELQKLKTHPKFKKIFNNAERINYGARAISCGGLQSLPEITFPGGLLTGDSAGFLNTARLKGIHNAIKSGMLAAQSILDKKEDYKFNIKNSEIVQELYKARNIRPAFNYGLIPGMLYTAFDSIILRGHAPWTLRHNLPAHLSLSDENKYQKIAYPKPDNKITFDKTSSLYLSNVYHDEHSKCHLVLKDKTLYSSAESFYCPAGVYEILDNNELQINFQNCLHCKACDIKNTQQNITWECPEDGGGPQYFNM